MIKFGKMDMNDSSFASPFGADENPGDYLVHEMKSDAFFARVDDFEKKKELIMRGYGSAQL